MLMAPPLPSSSMDAPPHLRTSLVLASSVTVPPPISMFREFSPALSLIIMVFALSSTEKLFSWAVISVRPGFSVPSLNSSLWLVLDWMTRSSFLPSCTVTGAGALVFQRLPST